MQSRLPHVKGGAGCAAGRGNWTPATARQPEALSSGNSAVASAQSIAGALSVAIALSLLSLALGANDSNLNWAPATARQRQCAGGLFCSSSQRTLDALRARCGAASAGRRALAAARRMWSLVGSACLALTRSTLKHTL